MIALSVALIACLVFAVRLVRRQSGREEVFLFAFCAMHFVVVQGTILLRYGVWSDMGGPCWRYYYPALPLVLGFVALPFATAVRRLPKRKLWLGAGVALVFAGQLVQGLRCRAADNGYGRDWKTVRWAAAAIRRDFKGCARPDNAKASVDEYLRVGRPAVWTCMSAVPYYAGGRLTVFANSPRGGEECLADADYVLDPYFVMTFSRFKTSDRMRKSLAADFTELARFHDGRHEHVLLKRVKPEN